MLRRNFIQSILVAGSAGALRASAPAVLSGPLVVSDQWPQATDLVSWTRDVMRMEGLENAPETLQGRAFFRWVRLFNRMAVGGMIQAFEGEYGKEQYVTDAHKNLFVYGWGFCDTTSRAAEAAWCEYKQDRDAAERVCVQNEGGGFHTMYRLRLDGNYGAFDPRYGYYVVERDAPNARILDWDGVGVDENLLRNQHYKHRSQPFFEHFGREWDRALALRPAFYPSTQAWRDAGAPDRTVFSVRMHRMGTSYHDMSFRLPRGTTIERVWDNTARKFYVPVTERAQREDPWQPSGRFYRVTETMLDGNWVKYDPNYQRMKPYLATIPRDEGYSEVMAGCRSIGQAWGRLTYKPPLESPDALDTVIPGSSLVHASSSPYLRTSGEAAGESTFDIYCPYVLVDGTLTGELAGDSRDDLMLEIRVQRSKVRHREEPDEWSDWEVIHRGPGRFSAELGRPRFRPGSTSIHGKYRFQARVSAGRNPARSSPAGLKALEMALYFENSITSLPRIFAGRNTVRFKVEDASRIRGPVQVAYRYQTERAENVHEQVLRAGDFRANEALYEIRAPGLVRCNSLTVAY